MSKFAEAMMANNGAASNDDKQPNGVPIGKTRSGEKFDLMKVDYQWVDACDDKRELRLAYESLVEDSGFPDLTKHAMLKLKELDKHFKSPEDFARSDPEAEAKAAKDVD